LTQLEIQSILIQIFKRSKSRGKTMRAITPLKNFFLLWSFLSCIHPCSLVGTEPPFLDQKTPSYMPISTPSHLDFDFFVEGAYTLWVPYQEGNAIAFSGNTSDVERGNVLRPSTKECSGFKVALGVHTPHDDWTATLEYTWFFNPGFFSYGRQNIDQSYRLTFDPLETGTAHYIESRWKSNFNRIDGTLDRSFYLGNYFTFSPSMGLLGAWETQILDQNGIISSAYNEDTWKQSWWAIGPYGGAETAFFFTKSSSFYVIPSGALLLANHSLFQSGSEHSDYAFNQKDCFYNVEPMIEILLGLRQNLSWTQWALCFDVAWQLQTYFSHNGFQSYSNPMGVMGNYSMQGLSASATLSF